MQVPHLVLAQDPVVANDLLLERLSPLRPEPFSARTFPFTRLPLFLLLRMEPFTPFLDLFLDFLSFFLDAVLGCGSSKEWELEAALESETAAGVLSREGRLRGTSTDTLGSGEAVGFSLDLLLERDRDVVRGGG